MEMRYQKDRIMYLIVNGRVGQNNTCQPANDEQDQKPCGINHRHAESDAATKHCGHPIINFDACRDSDNHRCNAKGDIDVGPLPHRKKVVQPDGETKHRNGYCRIDKRYVTIKPFATIGRKHFGKDPERRQNQQIYLGVPK